MDFKKGVDYIGIAVAFFVHDGKGNFVMGKRSAKCRDEHGRWDSGSGGLKFGEKVEDGLRRELMEEYGAEPIEIKFLGFRDVHRVHEGKPTHWIGLDFKVLVDPIQVRNTEPEMKDEISWFRLGNLPSEDQLHSQLLHTLQLYHDKLW